jgi:phage regulator Rha-like protein
LENSPRGEEILDSVIASLQKRMEQVRDDVFDDVSVLNDEVSIKSGSTATFIGKVHNRLLSMISLFKERSETKKMMETIRRQGMVFDSVDYAELARRFDVSDQDVMNIIEQFKKCFDQRGYFLRADFEAKIPYFMTHEKKIFEFLWSYLKETLHRTDRVAFLNSLQTLIQKMKQPKRALRFLLADLCHDPSQVDFSDRNAFMLGSLLLRKYNKELKTDIELTPEEVLFVRKGLNDDISRYAAWRLDVDQQRFHTKVETVHQRLIQSLANQNIEAPKYNPHFLLSLEREAFIFLSLVSGTTARQILINALKEYGNPESEIYTLVTDEKLLLLFLQHLKVLIRGIGRTGQIDDLNLLAGLKKNEEGFCQIYSADRDKETVRRILLLADASMKNITTLQ